MSPGLAGIGLVALVAALGASFEGAVTALQAEASTLVPLFAVPIRRRTRFTLARPRNGVRSRHVERGQQAMRQALCVHSEFGYGGGLPIPGLEQGPDIGEQSR